MAPQSPGAIKDCLWASAGLCCGREGEIPSVGGPGSGLGGNVQEGPRAADEQS